MKKINMTTAISYLPEEFITMEMAETAAKEHRAELIDYLPESMITPQILDTIFEGEHSGWGSWDLSRIPEEKRNRIICLRAVKTNRNNFSHVPEKYRNGDILEALFGHGCFLDYLPVIPESSWNVRTVTHGLYTLYRRIQNPGEAWRRNHTPGQDQHFIRTAKVMLSFVPSRAKRFSLWKKLVGKGYIAPHTIDKMIPKCFKQSEYYRRRCI
ncbi:MAG: hypothetical protein ACM687_15680 [Bacteroidales bacterium]